MRLRTILNELPITSSYIHDDELLEWDLVVSPEWNVGSKGVVCLGSMADFQSNDVPQTGDGIMRVYVKGELDEEYHKPPSTWCLSLARPLRAISRRASCSWCSRAAGSP